MDAQTIPSLELIQIASPCTANWDDMPGDERMRQCRECNLKVFNLSDMTRDEATAFLAKREGRICVRMFKRANGTVLTRDCPVGVAALRARFVRLVLAIVALLLTMTATAIAAFAKAPFLRSFLAQSKIERLYQQNNMFMVMGDICPAPPTFIPAPWQDSTARNSPEAQPTLGRPDQQQ